MKTREFFHFAHPIEKLKATDKYCSSVSGSMLWDLRGDTAKKLYSSWRTNVKLAWDLPRNTKNYFIDSLLAPGSIPPEVSVMSRFVTLFQSLLQSPSTEVQICTRLAARDIRSNIGANIAAIKNETGLNPWLLVPEGSGRN